MLRTGWGSGQGRPEGPDARPRARRQDARRQTPDARQMWAMRVLSACAWSDRDLRCTPRRAAPIGTTWTWTWFGVASTAGLAAVPLGPPCSYALWTTPVQQQREALASTSRGAQVARLFMRILQLQRTGWMEMDVGVACCWWAWSRKPEAAEGV